MIPHKDNAIGNRKIKSMLGLVLCSFVGTVLQICEAAAPPAVSGRIGVRMPAFLGISSTCMTDRLHKSIYYSSSFANTKGGVRCNAEKRSSSASSSSSSNSNRHSNPRTFETLLDLAIQKKDDFIAAIQDMEHHTQLDVAEALIYNIRKSTNGGMLPSADGTLPKLAPEQREIVITYVPAVIKIMDILEKNGHHHRDARVALYATEALSYDVSVKSLVQAAPQLARIFRNIDMMVEKHPNLKGGAPFIIQGMMHLNAPVPLRSVKKAKESFESAFQVNPSSARNNYFCGVAAILEKNYGQAYKYFSEALRLTEEAAAMTKAASEEEEEQASSRMLLEAEEPIDEYLESQCRLGLHLSSSHMK